jgi:hypothetical protein
MNLPQGKLQQDTTQACTFTWTNASDTDNIQCSTGFGSSTVTISGQDSSDETTDVIECNGNTSEGWDISDGDTMTIAFGTNNSNATPEPTETESN